MAGFGSESSPFNEAFGRIIEVHWKRRPVCEGETSISAHWGTLADNSFENYYTGGGGGGLAAHVYGNDWLLIGVWNNTEACNALYEITAVATLSGTTIDETYSYSGVLTPGQSFIVGIYVPGTISGPPYLGLPSLDVPFRYAFGEYRHLNVDLWTMTVPP